MEIKYATGVFIGLLKCTFRICQNKEVLKCYVNETLLGNPGRFSPGLFRLCYFGLFLGVVQVRPITWMFRPCILDLNWMRGKAFQR